MASWKAEKESKEHKEEQGATSSKGSKGKKRLVCDYAIADKNFCLSWVAKFLT